MHSCARWNSNRPIFDELRRDHDVGRIAREARARDAVLRDVEGVDHHGGDAGRVRPARLLARPPERGPSAAGSAITSSISLWSLLVSAS